MCSDIPASSMIKDYSIDWTFVLSREKELAYLFEILVPAANKRNASLRHTTIVCKYPRLLKLIQSKLFECYAEENMKRVDLANARPGDVAAIFTSITEGCVILVNSFSRMQKPAREVLSQALTTCSMRVPVGKGSASSIIEVDIPQFTLIFLCESGDQIPKDIYNCFENVIKITGLKPEEICEIEVKATAQENGMIFEEGVISQIVQMAQGNYRRARSLVCWIRDYMLVNEKVYSVIPREDAMDIIAKFHL